MKSFLDHLKEEVLPSVQVADGGLDIDKPAVRAAINAAIAGVVSQPAVTPYVVFNRLSKLLAQYHIILPRKFLEGDRGVEVFEIRQYGHRMGMTDSGEFVNEVPSTHYLFMQYGIISPFGITYAKPVVGGMFSVMARLVDKAELDKLLDMAEITMAEEAEVNQAIAKANAPKDPMHDITSDEKKKGNKEAVAASEKKNLDEDKDPCWKGYEMVGMKKKGGRKVPNCVPTNEEQIEELNREQGSMLNRYIGKTTDNPKREKGRNLALKKKWGDKEFGLPEPKVKAVDRHVKEEQVDEMAPPGAKFKRMAKHIKAGYAKDGKLTDAEKNKAFGATWKAYRRSKMEEGRVEDVMQKPEKEHMKKIAKHAIAHGADIKKLSPRKKKVAEENQLDELHYDIKSYGS